MPAWTLLGCAHSTGATSHPAMRTALIRSTLAPLMLAALVCGVTAPAHGSLAQSFARSSTGDRLFGGHDLAYGSDPRQRLSFWGPSRPADRPAPLILFVHGGGWKRGASQMDRMSRVDKRSS